MTSLQSPEPLVIVEASFVGATVGWTRLPDLDPHDTRHRRDLASDVEAIRAWGPAAVITLFDALTLEQAPSAAGFGPMLDEAGIEWHHIPNRWGTPGEVFENLWGYSGLRLREHLRAGRRVLVHGPEEGGAATTVAARLLIEIGCDPGNACALTRSKADTAASEARSAMMWGAVSGEAVDRRLSRIIGGLMGGALADGLDLGSDPATALGPMAACPYEPLIRDGLAFPTQTSVNALALAEGMAEALRAGAANPDDYSEPLRQARRRWTGRSPRWGGIDPFGLVKEDQPWLRRCHGREGPADRLPSSVRAMISVGSIGLLASNCDTAFEVARGHAAASCPHDQDRLSAAAFAHLIRKLVDGRDVQDATGQVVEMLDGRPGAQRIFAALRLALKLGDDPDVPEDEAVLGLGRGWVSEEALAIAVYATIRQASLLETLRCAYGGDAHNKGAAILAGQIWGVQNGISALPHPFIRRLDLLVQAGGVARRILRAVETTTPAPSPAGADPQPEAPLLALPADPVAATEVILIAWGQLQPPWSGMARSWLEQAKRRALAKFIQETFARTGRAPLGRQLVPFEFGGREGRLELDMGAVATIINNHQV